MNEDEQKVTKLDEKLRKALDSQDKSIKNLEKASVFFTDETTLDDEDAHRALQLVLQYRLDTTDTIKKLLAMNNALCHALGIDEHNSFKKNLDVAAYLLGEDNLLRELSALSGLWRQLNKVLALTEKSLKLQQEEKKLHRRILEKLSERFKLGHYKESTIGREKVLSKDERVLFYCLKDALGHEEYFRLNIEQLTEAYQHYGGLPKFGLIYDYLAGLKGPISQFQMAIQHGVGLSKVLADKISRHLGLPLEKQSVSQLVHQLNHTLNQHVTLQKQLQQTEQNHKAYWRELENNLTHNREHTPKPADRFDKSMHLRRTMNIFGR